MSQERVVRISTTSSIPPEVLGEIFCCCTFVSPDAPVILESVCKSWREIVCRTPRMWTRLRLSLGPSDLARAAEKAGLWLVMAGSCFVDVYVDIRAIDAFGTSESRSSGSTSALKGVKLDDLSIPLSSILHSNLSRIRSMSVHAQTEAGARDFMYAISYFPHDHDTPAVDRIKLHITDTPSSSASPVSLHPETIGEDESSVLDLYPVLKSMKLINLSLPSSWLHPRGLTHLYFIRPLRSAPISLLHIFDLLLACPGLVMLEIESRILEAPRQEPLLISNAHNPTKEDEQGHPNDNTIYLHSLTRLYLRVNNIHGLLSHMALPRLETLHLTDLDGRAAGQWTGDAVKILLMRTPLPRIRFLTIRGVENLGRARDGVWAWCLQRLRWIETVECANGGIDFLGLILDHAQNRMGEREARGVADRADVDDIVCPRLRHVRIRHPNSVYNDRINEFRSRRPDVQLELQITRELKNEVLGSGGNITGRVTIEEPRPRGFGFGTSISSARVALIPESSTSSAEGPEKASFTMLASEDNEEFW